MYMYSYAWTISGQIYNQKGAVEELGIDVGTALRLFYLLARIASPPIDLNG